MRFAFVLFKYFPFGGLQRDMLAIAQVALARGHELVVFCAEWRGDKPAGVELRILPSAGFSNAKKMQRFARQLSESLQRELFDIVVGFNKFAGLDVYYAADSCFAAKAFEEKSWLYRQSPRAKLYLALEAAVFDQASHTQVLELSQAERPRFQRYYQTSEQRFHTLPPGIWPQHRHALREESYGASLRKKLGFDDKDLLLIAIGSGFKTKGLDRSIQLLADYNKTATAPAHLMVVGQDKPAQFLKQAQQFGVQSHITFLGGRDDVADLLQAADILLHPARKENTGNVLLEAMVAGRPVISTDVCGYSHYVVDANMGVVMPSPFSRSAYLDALKTVISQNKQQWRKRGTEFAQRDELYARSEHAVNLLERFGKAAQLNSAHTKQQTASAAQ